MPESLNLYKTFVGIPEAVRGHSYILRCDPKGENLLFGLAYSVIIKNIKDPSKNEVVTHHAKKVTAACYSPSGFYVASGDAGGNIKIWDTVNPEHMVKYEYRPISGAIMDISWSDDSKRIVVVGEGNEKFGFVFSWDTGTSLGNIIGHNKTIRSVDYRKHRPFSIVTSSEDFSVMFYKGPPFKYEKTCNDHTNFANCVRFSPDGAFIASAGQDGKILIFDGANYELKKTLYRDDKNSNAHAGGIYGLSWSGCSKFLLTASGDKTCKVWNIESGNCENVFTLGKEISDQQMGCLWVNEHIISLSLDGKLTFLDRQNVEKPIRVIWGHNKSINCLVASEDKKFIFTCSFDGFIIRWNVETGECNKVDRNQTKNFVNCLDIKGNVLSYFGDSKVMVQINSDTLIENHDNGASPPSLPLSLAMVDEYTSIVGCEEHILVVSGGKITCTLKSNFHINTVAVRSDSKLVLAGGESSNQILCFDYANKMLTPHSIPKIEITNNVIHLGFSPNGKFFTVGTNLKTLEVFDGYSLTEVQSWGGHDNRVNFCSWAPDNNHIVSCGIDGHLNIWKADDRFYRVELRNAHRGYNIASAIWLDNENIVTVGQQDCSIKFWKISY